MKRLHITNVDGTDHQVVNLFMAHIRRRGPEGIGDLSFI